MGRFTCSNHQIFVVQKESKKMCRLKKFFYELKQSPRACFGRFAFIVRDFDLSRSQKDHSVFWRQHQGKRLLFIVYVNDIIITGDDAQGIADLNYYL